MAEGTIIVTQTRSAIGSKPKQRGTLRALGLGRIGKSNTLPDRPEVRGMIARVPHLVRVTESASQAAVSTGEDPTRPEAAPAAPRAEANEEVR